MTLAVDFNRVFGSNRRGISGKFRPNVRREPALQLIRIMTPDEYVIGNIEILRTRPVVLHAAADILQPAMLQRETAGSRDIFIPSRNATLVFRTVMPSK